MTYSIETSLALISSAGIASWAELLDYDGCWSPDLLSVGVTAAIERGIHELQSQRLVISSALAGLFKAGRRVNKKLADSIAGTLKDIERVKMLHRGVEPETIEGLEEDDQAEMFIRVFSRMGVRKR